MGLETYLLKIKFKKPIPETELLGLFNTIAMTSLHDKDNKKTTDIYGSYYFELRTKNGLTEAHCLIATEENTLNTFNIRFSIISPTLVIEQTFKILQNLNQIHPVKIFDTEIYNHFYRRRRKGNSWFKGFRRFNKVDNNIEQLCYIPINTEEFKQNKHGITKRDLILNNELGEVIESGLPTLDFIYKNQLYDKYIGWFKKEML